MPGEFEIVDALAARFASADPDVLTAIGDDAAVLRARGSLVVSTDTVVEGVHVDLGISSPADAGFKAVTSALSDIAAMGAVARWAVVAAVLPERLLEDADAIAAGMDEAARMCGVALVGGDTTRGEHLVLTVTVLGLSERPVLRSGARPGDMLCVTGSLGAAACGLAVARAPQGEAAALLAGFPDLLRRHRRPLPRLREGQALAEAGARAMIDLSDGLGSDAGHLARASGVAVAIDPGALPMDRGVPEAAALLRADATVLALAGGEDYELAVVLDPTDVRAASAAVAPTPLTVVGRIETGEPGVRWDREGPVPRGWDHFA